MLRTELNFKKQLLISTIVGPKIQFLWLYLKERGDEES
jgi:hypothetical protein